jgi:putative radical SAM enzyme (TIGR03279 family)
LDVRAHLLGVERERADISGKMRRMMDAGIEIHAQVVLCPGINDGDVLLRTVEDLAAEHPRVKSVAIVPLGLTDYNTDERLTPVTPEWCRRLVREFGPVQKDLRARLGTTFAFLGDEIYLRAGLSVPSRRHYGDYPQIEDGVGMVRSFAEDFARMGRRLEKRGARAGGRARGTVMTGRLFAPVLTELIAGLNEKLGTRLKVLEVSNRYFGAEIVVAGLLTGRCVLSARGEVEGDFLVLPKSVFKSDEQIMLDGTTHEDLQRDMGLPVHALDLEELERLLA